MFDIKNQNTFLGGQNVHNLIIIGLLIYIILKLMKKSEESGLTQSLGNKKPSLRGGELSSPKPNDITVYCTTVGCELVHKSVPGGGQELKCLCPHGKYEEPAVTT